ncbi:hypothetical protein [Paracoccus sp. SM22M-07]|uniref:hypothetical protein n=1 Tax=Paracoccus sp. SM22M-07 TaxID=1520813 RepID=UPI00091E4691|nr:hypothetical protein [Paracoccus sp. SM22M-07]OJH45692.1 hypothetical protein IE00_00015 [Paracoccus sp. SM22M-07]
MSLRVQIVEEEFLIALDLQDLMEDVGHVVTGVAKDFESCKRAARETLPNVSSMDLRLGTARLSIDASRWFYNVLGVCCIFMSGNLADKTHENLADVAPFAFVGMPILMHQLKRVERHKYPAGPICLKSVSDQARSRIRPVGPDQEPRAPDEPPARGVWHERQDHGQLQLSGL